MIRIDLRHEIEGITAFEDDAAFNRFCLLPNEPRYRLDSNGDPVFKFMEYRDPVDRGDGHKGGGFIIFDVEFVVPEAKMPKIMETLGTLVKQRANELNVPPPAVEIGNFIYTSGEAVLNLFNDEKDLVQSKFNPGQPSLFGNNVTSFALELTPEGAALAKQALQGKGGVVQVVYKLKFWAKLPPFQVHGWFNSLQFYSFYQTINIDWHMWSEDSYRETVREQTIASQSMGVEITSDAPIDPSLKEEVRQWALDTVEKTAEKKMIAALTPVPDDQRKVPDGIENVSRDVQKTNIDSFDLLYRESSTVEYGINPQGTLPNITSLTDKSGNPVRWEDYAVQVDLDDPFFRQLRVDTYVNADFAHLPIHSVEVKLLYNDKPMPNMAEGAPEGEVVLSKAEDVGHFGTYIDTSLDQGKQWKYQYSYQVNYQGTSQIYQSPVIETDEGNLTIGVDDVGILSVQIAPGDINWDQVTQVQVKLSYEDPQEHVGPLEDDFVLTKDKPTHLFQEVIFKPFRKSYRYQAKYFMKDGREYQVKEQEGRAKNLFINDPFAGLKSVKVIAGGDLKNRIANIFLDLKYSDEANDYTQSKSVVLNAGAPFADWSFPVINESQGKLTYSGNAMLTDGTSRAIDLKTADSGVIIVPKPYAGFIDVLVVTDLVDFSACKLVRVTLIYQDEENLIHEQKDYIFSAAKKESQAWHIGICDQGKNQYAWEANFFMLDNSQRKTGSTASSEQTIVLEVPPAS
jgi:hypothetical protein